jgi:hypothetical protein
MRFRALHISAVLTGIDAALILLFVYAFYVNPIYVVSFLMGMFLATILSRGTA